MSSLFKRLRGAALALGVTAGAVLGGFLSNQLFQRAGASADTDALRDDFFKALPVHAVASNSMESLVMCTGEMDTGIEAVYVLDAVTGELRGWAHNTNTRKFSMQYTYSNFLEDLNAKGVKKPKFIMVTGQLPSAYGRSIRVGKAILYVAELNSGYVAAYGVPWDSTRYANGQPTSVALVPLDRFKFRESIIRP